MSTVAKTLEARYVVDFGSGEFEAGRFRFHAVTDFDVASLVVGRARWHAGEAELPDALGAFGDAGRAGDDELVRALVTPELEEKERKAEEVVGVKVADHYEVDVERVGPGLVELLERGGPYVKKILAVENE
jgi:hypothetical protein